jgi:hypothetical protein
MAAAGDLVVKQFSLHNSDNEPADADALPVVVLVRNGEDTTVDCTVENLTTGVYKVSLTIPSDYEAGDEVTIRLSASVDGQPGIKYIDLGEIARLSGITITTSDETLEFDIYGSLEGGDAYFALKLNADAWDDASDEDKLKALYSATQAIDQLNFRGDKTDEDQSLQFPRDDETTVPRDIEIAAYEIAIMLLDGVDPEMEAANLAAVSQGISSVRVTYDRSAMSDHILAGIVSITAWQRLRPYLYDSSEIILSRV